MEEIQEKGQEKSCSVFWALEFSQTSRYMRNFLFILPNKKSPEI